jgi:Cu-processing system ATP-binding protein
MIRIENLSKKFKKLPASDQITAHFERGQVIALIGPNGSGKTTLIKCILGMVKADSGSIFVNNHPINGDPSYREQIGYMPQIGRYPDNMRVGQLFDMLRTIRNKTAAETDNELIIAFNLAAILDKPMRTLSGGTRQKVSAAVAFLFNPDILILDEPTAGLDPLAAEILKEKIIAEKKKNKLIIITSHILSDLDELTTHIVYLQEGKLLFFKDLQTLQEDTGELRLGKAIASVMRGENPRTDWVSQLFEVNQNNKIY